jgi:porphobilinogen synthase
VADGQARPEAMDDRMSRHAPQPPAPFPLARPRRLRASAWIRDLVAEHRLAPADLIWPIFVREGTDVAEPVASLPGVARLSVDRAVEAAGEAADLGIPCVALFPFTEARDKNPDATEAWNPDNLVCRATRAIKAAHPGLGVMLDVALDPYNSEGHDGLVRDGVVVNDATLEALERQTLCQAEAGADILGPSDMMDGRVGVMRRALEREGLPDVAIMSYAAKYASAFYGPFRDAVGATGALKGDKKTYQMDPANGDEALREVATDLAEGADMVMVKPGLPYLDVCRRVKDALRRADLRLPGLGRVRDDRGGGGERLARRRAGHAGEPDRLQARGLRRRAHLLRPAGGAALG